MTKTKDVTRSPKPPFLTLKSKEAVKSPKRAIVTKAATIRRLLVAAKGATIDELAAATGWQVHSLRGFMSGTLKKKLGLEVTSRVLGGCRRYHIAEARAST